MVVHLITTLRFEVMSSIPTVTSFGLDFARRVFTCRLIIIFVLNKQTVNLLFIVLKHDTFPLSAPLPAQLHTGFIQNVRHHQWTTERISERDIMKILCNRQEVTRAADTGWIMRPRNVSGGNKQK